MLGTPNYGSFAIVQAMTGDEKMVRLLAAADLTKSLPEVLGVIGTFVGSYQMLPWLSKLPASLGVLFRAGNWGSCPVCERHLARALRFQQEMEAGGDDRSRPDGLHRGVQPRDRGGPQDHGPRRVRLRDHP